jgi:Cd2+/Zn2+-exporting ATPase
MVLSIEKNSTHPIANSLVNYCLEKNISHLEIIEYKDLPGYGSKGLIDGKTLYLGNVKLLEQNNISYPQIIYVGNIIYVAYNCEYIGHICISDKIKDDSKQTMNLLKSIGIKQTIMLTGDNKESALKVSSEVNIDKVYYSLLPQDKVTKISQIINEHSKGKYVAYVGDGTNDAPALVLSDVGVAMGGIGSDSAMEASDIVIMDDHLKSVYRTILLAKHTQKIAMINIIFALSIKFIILVLSSFGLVNMVVGIFGDVGVAILAVLNSISIFKYKIK